MSKKRIVISAGGTGGHLFPAQALAQQLTKEPSSPEILFVAGGLKTSKYFDRLHFPYEEVACGPLLSKNPIKCWRGLRDLAKGISQSVTILKRVRPHLVVGFGSYYTVPIVLAARWLNIPILLHEANSIPGKANSWLASLATCVGVNFPVSKNYFKGRVVEVGLPLREGYQAGAVGRDAAHHYYGLDPCRTTLMIFGGSQGAQAINQKVKECLPLFKALSLQVIHFTGKAEMVNELSQSYALHNISSRVKVFEDKMQMAWAAADAFIGRSGASAIAEAIEFEVPGLLIPYPFATDQHQDKNADFFVDDVGAGWKLSEEQLTGENLSEKISALFSAGQLSQFQKAMKNYKKRQHQMTLSELVMNLA